MTSCPFRAHNIPHLSPSTLNLFAASPAMFCLEKLLKKRQPVGAAAHRGSSAEAGVTEMLYGAPLDIGVQKALWKFDSLTALSGDPRRESERAAVPGLVEQAFLALKPYGKPSRTQGKISHSFDGIGVPVIGFFDFVYDDHGLVIDLKTQLSLAGKIKVSHARQVALYQIAISDNFGGRILYATPKKSAIYELENARDHLASLAAIARALKNFLTTSDDPLELAAMVAPDIESFYFADPLARAAAFEIWSV